MYGDLAELPDGRWQLRFTRILPHPPEKVWRAVTQPQHLASWFPTTIDGERSAGAPLRFSFPEGVAEPITGKMLAYEDGTVMELDWGGDIIRLELREAPEGTELTLLDTLSERGKAARDGAGWHTCLDALAAGLSDDEDAGDQRTAWPEVNRQYIERFGPEAATIGPPEGLEGTHD